MGNTITAKAFRRSILNATPIDVLKMSPAEYQFAAGCLSEDQRKQWEEANRKQCPTCARPIKSGKGR